MPGFPETTATSVYGWSSVQFSAHSRSGFPRGEAPSQLLPHSYPMVGVKISVSLPDGDIISTSELKGLRHFLPEEVTPLGLIKK